MHNFNTYVKLLLLMMCRIYLSTTFAHKYYVFINCFCNDLHTRFRLSAFRNLIIIMTIIIRSIGNQSQCKPDFPYKIAFFFFSSLLLLFCSDWFQSFQIELFQEWFLNSLLLCISIFLIHTRFQYLLGTFSTENF